MPFSRRSEIAELWRHSARLTRADIFGPDDPLRPVYENRGNLDWQVDVAAVGMVGTGYRPGGLAILSINPAGGSPTSRTDFLSDRMYEGFKHLRNAAKGRHALAAFEESNKAFITSMQSWGSMTRYLEQIRKAMNWDYEDIAYLYVVPFRTRGDNGSQMERTIRGRSHIEKGYEKHLKGQLDLLSPGLIVGWTSRPTPSGRGTGKEAIPVWRSSTSRGSATLIPKGTRCCRSWPSAQADPVLHHRSVVATLGPIPLKLRASPDSLKK